MSFGDDLRAFTIKVDQRTRDVFVESVASVHGSVVDGSSVTAAPGQPVDTGNLRNSWQESFPSQWLGEVSTNVEYARAIEEGQQPPYQTPGGTLVTPRPMTLRSKVGGFHSVKLTQAGWAPLLSDVVRRVVG